MQSTSVFNPYRDRTLQGNWYEERFYHADTRRDEGLRRTRPLTDDVGKIPRLTRVCKPTGEVFQPGRFDPAKQYMTVSRATYVPHQMREESVTARRMNTSPEDMRRMLSATPQQFIPDWRMPQMTPEQRFKSEYQRAYVRHL
jgi:hypothetical protein